MSRPEPVFLAPWHGQLFALTVQLNAAGHFDWHEWTVRFGAGLKRHGLSRALDGGEDYFAVWLEVLEQILADLSLAGPGEVSALRDAWAQAYAATPHGAPVRLDDALGQGQDAPPAVP